MHKNEIFVLDDDANVRETLRIILQRAGYAVICFFDDAALLKAVRARIPVCIFLDIVLPGRSGMEILKDLATFPAPVIMISGHGDIPTAIAAIKVGARDFIEKPFAAEEIVHRLESVLHERDASTRVGLPSFDPRGLEGLTHREREVAEHMVMGQSSKETGVALKISPRTVEEHRANIMQKLGVKSSAELVLRVLKQRELKPGQI